MASVKLSNLPPGAKAKLPKPGKVGAMGLGINGIFAGIDAVGRIQNGEGVVSSVAKAGVNAVIADTVAGLMGPAAMGVMMVGGVAVAGAQMAIENGRENIDRMGAAYGGAKYNKVINSEAAATMRQRGMAMINQNGEATRSVLGSEARAYFRNSVSQY